MRKYIKKNIKKIKTFLESLILKIPLGEGQ